MKEFDPGEAPSIASITDQVRALPVGMPVTSMLFPRRYRGVRRRRGKRGAGQRSGRSLDSRHPRRRHPVRGVRRQAYRHRRRRRQGRRARRQGRGHGARDRRKTALDRQCRAASRWRGGVVGRQDRVRPQRQGRGEDLRCAVDRRRARLRAKGPAPGGRPLQRRDAVVSQHGGEAGISGMGRLASRRHLQPRQQIPGHRACTSRRCTAGGLPTTGTCG